MRWTYDGGQLRCLCVCAVAFQTSEDAAEATHALRVRDQRTHRICVLRIELDGRLREREGVGDRAPPGPRLRLRLR